mmetsp:Transcript_612/g.896  ORF Transcript_612/g.896 Transcript_612/m.896 type:complete len:212 (+) Transcript_612:322-957(+)
MFLVEFIFEVDLLEAVQVDFVFDIMFLLGRFLVVLSILFHQTRCHRFLMHQRGFALWWRSILIVIVAIFGNNICFSFGLFLVNLDGLFLLSLRTFLERFFFLLLNLRSPPLLFLLILDILKKQRADRHLLWFLRDLLGFVGFLFFHLFLFSNGFAFHVIEVVLVEHIALLLILKRSFFVFIAKLHFLHRFQQRLWRIWKRILLVQILNVHS